MWTKDKDDHLYIIWFKNILSRGDISHEQYTHILGFKYQARTELWDYHLIYMYICFKLLNKIQIQIVYIDENRMLTSNKSTKQSTNKQYTKYKV